jgi:ABC-type molybdate transport system substrate-binding protein
MLRKAAGILAGVWLAAQPGAAGANGMVHVAVDESFASAAAALAPMFTSLTGHQVTLDPLPGAALQGRLRAGADYDVLLAADAETPARIVAEGLGLADSVFTYATAGLEPPADVAPKDAVLLSRAGGNPAARAFMAFLATPEAWEVIVSHGFGAH